MKILMKHIQACYLVILLSWCYAATTAGRKSGSKSSTGQTKSNVDGDDVHHGQGSFVKPHLKKPLIPGLVGDKENSPTNTTVDPVQQQVYRAEIIDRTSISHSIEYGGSLLEYVTPLCSPRAYRVHLKNGNCRSVVHTQMCYGQCTSFIYPLAMEFLETRNAKNGVNTSCSCCSSVKMSTKRHDVKCSVRGSARKTRKTFYVPFAKKCACRPCRST